MRDLGSVCLRCRSRLLVASSARPVWQTISSYSTSSQHARSQYGHESSESIAPAPAAPRTAPATSRISSPLSTRTKKRKTYPGGPGPSKASKNSLQMFMNVIKEQTDNSNDTPAPAPESTDNLELLKDVAVLQSMLLSQDPAATQACFAFFESKIHPRIAVPGVRVPSIVRDRVGKVLLDRLSTEKAKDMESKDLPTVSRICQVRLDLGLFQPPGWARLVAALLDHVCGISASPNDYASIMSFENAMATREALLFDLLGAFRVLNVHPFTALRVGDAAKAATRAELPSLDDSAPPLRRNQLPREPFAVLFPHFAQDSLGDVSPVVIGTYVVLTDPANNSRSIKREGVSLRNAIARILSLSRPNLEELARMFERHPNLSRYVMARWPAVEIEIQSGSRSRSSAPPASSVNIHRVVGQAWRKGDVEAVQRAWAEFWGTESMPSPAKKQELARNAGMFSYFIVAFMSMRETKLAIEVWNAMQLAGVSPTLKTWTAMMDGCVRSKNAHGLKMVWERLLHSKIKLDTAIWTARISGLIKLGDANAAVAALIEMNQIWEHRDKQGENPAAVQPTAEPVNAVLGGLLRLGKSDDAKSVLSWASKQGIEPDIFTYNTLLRNMLKNGSIGEAKHLFKMMSAQNIEADVVTFSIMMEQMLNNVGEQTPEKQAAVVMEILDDMENTGAKANLRAYAKMIHILLNEGDRAASSVKAVLAHIWGQGLELTSHIYTMLAEHYFSRDPPDVAAVTALIENRRLRYNKDIDRVFWERVIKGYCQVGDTARALALFDNINHPGLVITFSTLYELLLALVRNGSTEAAMKFVVSCRAIKQVPELDGGEDKGRFWKHRFWHLVEEHGIPLREDLVPSKAIDATSE